MLYSDVEANSVLLIVDDDTTFTVLPTRRGGHEKTHDMRDRRRNVYVCLPRSLDALARLPNKHNNRPRCLRPPTVPTYSQLGDTRATST